MSNPLHREHSSGDESRPAFLRSPVAWVAAIGVGGAGVYLFAQHSDHLITALPFLILLACPLMMVFMHGGHRHGSRD